MKKLYTYCYNKLNKEFEKISLENDLCNIKDSCKKERIAIIKDVLEFNRLYSDKDSKGNKIEYLPMILMPSKLFIIVGSGLSVAMLNCLEKDKLKKIEDCALKVRIDNKVAFGYLNTKDQVKRYGLYKNDILILGGKKEKKVDKRFDEKRFDNFVKELNKQKIQNEVIEQGKNYLIIEVEGDWKHDLLASEEIAKSFKLYLAKKEEVGNTDSDWGRTQYNYI